MSQEIEKIRLGLPKGSLNTPGRGNTYEVLTDAGYDVRGYEPGKEKRVISIGNDPEIRPFLIRPQSAAVLLSRGMLDVAICGEDWIKEETINGSQNGIRKIGDLEYGQTRIVLAVPTESKFTTLSEFIALQTLRYRAKSRRNEMPLQPVLCFTEYVNLTKQRFMRDRAYQEYFGDVAPLVQIRSLIEGQNRLFQIISSDGVTEGFMDLGADIIADNTQSGNSLRDYGLKEIDEIMESSAGLYAGPSCVGWKETKAQEIFEQLYGAITGRKYFDVKFNIPLGQAEAIKEYIVSANLCADEPTVVSGDQFAQVNILIPRAKFPEVLRTLKGNYEATAFVRSEVKQFVR